MVQVYDPGSDTWAAGPPVPEPLHHATLVSTGTRLLVLGGFLSSFADGGAARPSSSVWMLNPREDGWTAGPPLLEGRGAAAGAWDGERVVYGGGVGPDGASADIFALEDGSWAAIGSLSAPRQHLAATSDGRGRVWFLGGRLMALADNTGAVDLVADGGVTPLGAAITPRSGLGAFWLRGAGGCAVGGETPGGTLPTVECVDESGAVAALPPLGVARHGLGVASLDRVAFALLGGTEPGLYVSATNEALRLDE